MKMMLWKEFRENLKWAVLALIGLGLAEFYGLTQTSSSYDDQGATLCKSGFLMVTTFGCAAVGLVLGLIQILPELRRDQWASLLHRPVSRAVIFNGKALAGILLYLFATVPPFLFCVWYAAAPGHFALPFVPGTILPGVASLCAGTAYYFAALFIGVRRGAWFGMRAFGFLAAVTGMAFIDVPLFRVAVAASVLTALALYLAGWGTILSNGALRDQPRLGRLASVAVVLAGAGCFLVLAIGILGMVSELFSSPDNYYSGTSYGIDLDGRVLKFTSKKDGPATVTDLAGNVIQDKRFTTSGSRYHYLLGFVQVSRFIGDPHDLDRDDDDDSQSYRRNSTYVVSASGSYDDGESWYYLPQGRQFVGYFNKTKQRIGAIGRDGFRPGFEHVEPLADRPHVSANDSGIPAFVQFGSAVYHSDFDQRRLTPLFSRPGTELFGTEPLRSNQDETLGLNWAALALPDKMLVVDKTGQIVATLPYHQNMDRWGAVAIAVNPGKDRFYLKYSPSNWIDYREAWKLPSYYEEMDAGGTLLHSYTVPPASPPQFTLTWEQVAVTSLVPPALYFGDLLYDKIGALCGSKRLAAELDSALSSDRPLGWKQMAPAISVVSLALAALALFWTRRMHFAWPRAWAWAGLVLAFNLAGLITLRLVADWPVRVRCPACQRKRPVEETHCPACSQPWPAPKRDGIEIFDQEPVAQPVP